MTGGFLHLFPNNRPVVLAQRRPCLRTETTLCRVCAKHATTCEPSARQGHSSCSASCPSRTLPTRSTRRSRLCGATATNPRAKQSLTIQTTMRPAPMTEPKSSLKRCYNERLQLEVEHGGCGSDLVVVELPEWRRWLVILHTRFSFVVLVDQYPQWGVQARSNVVLRHLEGEDRVANDVLDRLPHLAGEAQQRPVVRRAEQHEAAWTRQRCDLGLGLLGVIAGGSGSAHVAIEFAQLSLEHFRNFLERLVGRPSNMFHRKSRVIHRITSWALLLKLAVYEDAAQDQPGQSK